MAIEFIEDTSLVVGKYLRVVYEGVGDIGSIYMNDGIESGLHELVDFEDLDVIHAKMKELQEVGK